MKQYFISVAFLLSTGSLVQGEDNPYHRALQAENYDVKVTVLEAKRIGSTILRAQPSLGAEVHVRIRNYLPRALEPVLLINGEQAGYSIGVVGVEGDVTTIAFVVPEHQRLKDGARIAIQMGDDQRTRTKLGPPIRRSTIKPLDDKAAEEFNLRRQLPH